MIAEAPVVTGDRVAVSVIITSYNARDILSDCLQSIYLNPPRESFEILVVDDASTDGTSDMVRGSFPAVRLLRNDINRQYTFSNNRAIAEARGEYLYLLNNDTIVLPDAIGQMLAFLRKTPDAGAVGSRLLNEDGTAQWSVKALPTVSSALFGGRGIITRVYPDNPFTQSRFFDAGTERTEPIVAGYVSGASKMLPRAVVDKVGPLDERLFNHVDADYCKRMIEAGYKSYYLPTASVIHLNQDNGRKAGESWAERFRRSWTGAHGRGAGLSRRFRHLRIFHADSYLYYRKHLLKSAWSPMHIVVVFGLVVNFLILVAVQTVAELFSLLRGLFNSRPITS
jgi:N-acetylglucosaminyl-diphospho-decaprenol L-rhamnosyltransferase